MGDSEHICPECKNGKHPNCDFWAWDNELDEVVKCDCSCRVTATMGMVGLS